MGQQLVGENMSIKNKKALAINTIITMMLLLVGFILISATYLRGCEKLEGRDQEQTCYQSIGMRAATSLGGGSDINLVPILCRTTDQDLGGDREEIKKQIADSMSKCWWMFHEGRYEEIVNHNVEIRELVGLETGNKCFICYALLIKEEDLGTPDSIPKDEMLRYLRTTEYEKVGTTYSDYIQFGGGPGALSIGSNINPDSAYAIVFVSQADNGYPVISDVQNFFRSGYESAGLLDHIEEDVSSVVFDTLANAEERNCVQDIAGG